MLVIDIETTGNLAMLDFVDVPKTVGPGDAPKNYKKDEAIAAWMEKETTKREAAYQERLARMALDVDLAKIVALGWLTPDDAGVEIARNDEQEIALLKKFWSLVRTSSHIIGYNLRRFDLPIILRRSWVLRVKPVKIDMRKYNNRQVIDLMELLYHYGDTTPRARGLKKVAQMYGIENILPDVEGSQVTEMDNNMLAWYCASDVMMTAELGRRTYHYYWW